MCLRKYAQARGPALPDRAVLPLRFGRPSAAAPSTSACVPGASAAASAYRCLRIDLRHTFATHLVRAGVGLVTIRDLLGHRQITSTQIYLHVTAEDLRGAAARHPIGTLLSTVQHLLPRAGFPFQRPRVRPADG